MTQANQTVEAPKPELTAEERRKICQFLMERHRNEIKRIEAFARTYRG